jgi:hypothetical protein
MFYTRCMGGCVWGKKRKGSTITGRTGQKHYLLRRVPVSLFRRKCAWIRYGLQNSHTFLSCLTNEQTTTAGHYQHCLSSPLLVKGPVHCSPWSTKKRSIVGRTLAVRLIVLLFRIHLKSHHLIKNQSSFLRVTVLLVAIEQKHTKFQDVAPSRLPPRSGCQLHSHSPSNQCHSQHHGRLVLVFVGRCKCAGGCNSSPTD